MIIVTFVRALVVPLSAFAFSACSGPDARVYTARRYDANAACIEGSVPIGVVHVESLPSSCDAVCLLLDDALYVSTVCAPYPARATLVGPEETSECGIALTLLEAEASCGDDLPEPSDAGAGDASDADFRDANASALADDADGPNSDGGASSDGGSDAGTAEEDGGPG